MNRAFIDIHSKSDGLGSLLSPLAGYNLSVSGNQYTSMAAFLESLKVRDKNLRNQFSANDDGCDTGAMAQIMGKKYTEWKNDKLLFFHDREYRRDSLRYHAFLSRSLKNCVQRNKHLQKILLKTGDCILISTETERDPQETVLTNRELCCGLMRMREKMKKWTKEI